MGARYTLLLFLSISKMFPAELGVVDTLPPRHSSDSAFIEMLVGLNTDTGRRIYLLNYLVSSL